MKKLLCLGALCAALAVTVGCDDKKTTGGTPVKTNTGTATTTTKWWSGQSPGC